MCEEDRGKRRVEISGPEDSGAEQSAPEPAPSADTGAGEETEELTLEQQLQLLEEELNQERDLHLRAVAELRNFRQRMLRDQQEQLRYASVEVIESLIPTLDHLEMALKAAEEHGEGKTALAEGVWLTYRQLLDTLAQFGLQAIPGEGHMFDPNLHDAMERQEVRGGEPCEGMITAELRKGWKLHDRVLRPAQVRVAVERR